jgi:Family of unknown function (DUF6152)
MNLTTAAFGRGVVSAMLLCGTFASAHHSFAMFDRNAELVLTGTVKEFQFANPHSYIQLISNKDGQNWSIETFGCNTLVREKWKPASIQVGDKIVAHVHPLRNGAPGGELMWLRKADGTTLGRK